MEVTCKYCNKTFKCKPSEAKKRKYCSQYCYGKSQYLVLPPLTERQIEIINGCLLGDGGISKRESGKGNSNFEETHSIKYKEYCELLANELDSWFSYFYFNYPNDGKHHPTCQIRSKCHPFWTKLRGKWYPYGIKIVPRDITLTPLTLAHWFCGDGSNSDNEINIYTCGFSVEDVELLICKLNDDLDIKSHIGFCNRKGYDSDYPKIHVKAKSNIDFINLVKPHINVNCFQYKLNLRKTKCTQQTIWKFCDPCGNLHETESLKQFCAVYGLRVAGMCNVAKSRRKQYKGWAISK